MLFLKGKLLRILQSEDFTRSNGTVVPGKLKLQLMVQTPLKNGAMELVDIAIPKEKYSIYENKVNSDVEVEIGIAGKYNFYGI